MAGRRFPRIQRDSILFAAGMAGGAHQTLIERAEKPTLLILFGAMIGLPAFLRVDELRATKKPEPEPEPEPAPKPKPRPKPRPKPKPKVEVEDE